MSLFIRPIIVVLLAIAFAICLRLALMPDVMIGPDVAWVAFVAEQMQNGARLYVDYDDPNLPGAFWALGPAIWIKSAFGLSVSHAVLAWMCGVTLGIALLCRPALRRIGLPVASQGLILGALCVFSILGVGYDLGQREHFIALLILPAIVLSADGSTGFRDRPAELVLAGALAALALSIKPHYAICLIAVELLRWAHFRRVWPCPAILATAVIAPVLAGLQLAAYPQVLGNLSDRMLYATFALVPGYQWAFYPSLIGFAGLAWFQLRKLGLPPMPLLVFAAAALGGVLAFLLQWKGWTYHGLPIALFTTLFVAALAPIGKQAGAGHWALWGFAFPVVIGFYPINSLRNPDNNSATAADWFARVEGPVVVLGSAIEDAFPAAAEHPGGWGMRYPSLYQLAGVQQLAGTAKGAKIDAEYRAGILEDLRRSSPELIIIQTLPVVGGDPALSVQGWLDQGADFVEFMAAYTLVGAFDGAAVYQRLQQ